jgi:hypothetical protein
MSTQNRGATTLPIEGVVVDTGVVVDVPLSVVDVTFTVVDVTFSVVDVTFSVVDVTLGVVVIMVVFDVTVLFGIVVVEFCPNTPS